MVFPAVLFSFSDGTMGKIYRVYRKYSLGNFHTCHSEISLERQEGELVGVKRESIGQRGDKRLDNGQYTGSTCMHRSKMKCTKDPACIHGLGA